VKSNGTNWDLIFKIIGAVVAVGGLVFGIYQFQSQKDNGNSEKEKMLREQKVELYRKATEIAASFPQASDPKEAEAKKKEFWSIYYGQLSIVEDENVKNAMMKYGGALKAWENLNAPPSDFFPPSEFTYYDNGSAKAGVTFEQLAYELSQACKESIDK
jgi:hypothetical protein